MNDTPHTPAPGAPLGSLPRGGSGGMTMADVAYRRNALEHAVRFVGSGRAAEVVAAAAAFEAYLRDGGQPQPAPARNLLPPSFEEIAAATGEGTLWIVENVLRERRRQCAKGFTPAHDDRHTSEEIADQAAAAILGGARHLAFPLEPWIDPSQDRRDQLIQGIALAVAEVERIDRRRSVDSVRSDEAARAALEAEEHRTHGEDSAVNDPPLHGTRANLVLVDHLEPEEAAPIAVAVPAVLYASELSPSDWDDMHHALGRPRDPTKETHRNHYVTDDDARFRELAGYWTVREGNAITGGGSIARVTDFGRQALADVMRDNPELFPDIVIENGEAAS